MKKEIIEIVGGFLCVVVMFVLCGVYLYIFG
jgi:hypothetical protein